MKGVGRQEVEGVLLRKSSSECVRSATEARGVVNILDPSGRKRSRKRVCGRRRTPEASQTYVRAGRRADSAALLHIAMNFNFHRRTFASQGPQRHSAPYTVCIPIFDRHDTHVRRLLLCWLLRER